MSVAEALRKVGVDLQKAWIESLVALAKELGVTGETHVLVTRQSPNLCGWYVPKGGPYDPVYPQIAIEIGDGYVHIVRVEQHTAAVKPTRS